MTGRALLRVTLSCCVVWACNTTSSSQESASETLERKGAITRRGAPLTLVGPDLQVGDDAPGFELAGVGSVPRTVRTPEVLRLSALRGKIVVLSVVPSVDTPVCEAQTSQLAHVQTGWPAGTVFVTVSRDLPFAQRRFLQTHDAGSMMASDFREASFGKAWGVFVKETGLLARSVWIIDRDGRIAYREIVREQTQEPNYRALTDAVNRISGS